VRPGNPRKTSQSEGPAASGTGAAGTGAKGAPAPGNRVPLNPLRGRALDGVLLGLPRAEHGLLGRFDHTGVVGTCVSCHNGTAATGKPANHVLSSVDCDRCHTTSGWKPAVYDHAAVIPGTCATCHNALQAVGKPSGHVATTLSCDSCHYVLGWTPVKLVKPSVRPPSIPKQTPRPALPGRPAT
jgi:hypothetical protein